jgi:hypothetical protein
MNCSAQSRKDRGSACYDREALESRKEHKLEDNAVDMAATILDCRQDRHRGRWARTYRDLSVRQVRRTPTLGLYPKDMKRPPVIIML